MYVFVSVCVRAQKYENILLKFVFISSQEKSNLEWIISIW